MTQLVTTQNLGATISSSFPLANGAQAGRAVILVQTQGRQPPDINTAFTFNGAAPTNAWVNPESDAGYSTVIGYWADADLPASAGSYTVSLAKDGEICSVVEISGWDETAPQLIDTKLSGGAWTSPYDIPFVGTNANAFMIAGLADSSGAGIASQPDQVIQASALRHTIITKVDTDSDGYIRVAGSDGSDLIYSALAFNSDGAPPAPTLTTTLVDDVNDTALPGSVSIDVTVFTLAWVLVGTGTKSTTGAISITDLDLTLEAGQNITDTVSYWVNYQESAGPRQRTVQLTAAV